MSDPPPRRQFQFQLWHLLYIAAVAGVAMLLFSVVRLVLPGVTAAVIAAIAFISLLPGVGEFMRTGQPGWGIGVAMALQAAVAATAALGRFDFFQPTDWEFEYVGLIVLLSAFFLATLGVARAAIVRRSWKLLLAELFWIALCVAGIVIVVGLTRD